MYYELTVKNITSTLYSTEQHPGLCPPYTIIHATPLPKHISWNKPYRCKCDSDCKANYKCCEDSFFEHGVCKPAVHIPMKTISSDIEYSGSGDNINDNYNGSGDFSGDKESETFSGSGQNDIDDETIRIPSKYVNDDEDFEFSGLNEAIIDNYSGSGDFSGNKESERYSGSGHKPIDNDEFSGSEQINRTIHISSFSDDEDFEFSGFNEKIMDKYSGSGDFSVDKESERFSGSGHGSSDDDVEYLVTRIPITIYFNDNEDFEFSGFDEKIIDYYSGSGGISGDEDSERYSGSGHGLIDNDIEFLVTRMPIAMHFNDDEDFEFSGFDEKIIDYYSGSGDFSGDYESERYSGSGHAPIKNYAFTDNFDEKNHYSGQNEIQNLAAVDKFRVKEKFLDNSNSKIKNTETSKNSDKNNIIEESDDIYFFEPDISDISHDTETQIYPSNKNTNENEQNSEDISNKLDDIHKYKYNDDF